MTKGAGNLYSLLKESELFVHRRMRRLNEGSEQKKKEREEMRIRGEEGEKQESFADQPIYTQSPTHKQPHTNGMDEFLAKDRERNSSPSDRSLLSQLGFTSFL
jgi:hypothetical protein